MQNKPLKRKQSVKSKRKAIRNVGPSYSLAKDLPVVHDWESIVKVSIA